MKWIDLNSDLGESFGNYKLGDTAAILDIVSSANLACGFHGGDPMVMNESVRMCAEKGVQIGAHIGYPDLQGFGRRKMDMKPDELYNMTLYQLGALEAFTRIYGVKIRHINGHGALGNLSHKDPKVANALVKAAYDYDPNLMIAAPNLNSCMVAAAKEYGMKVITYMFHLDRNYDDEGFLAPRGTPDAMITDEDYALKRVVPAIQECKVRTASGKDLEIHAPERILIHGDQPKALLFAKKLRETVEAEGIRVMYSGDAQQA